MANIRFMEKAQLRKGADGRMAEPLKLPIGVDNFEKIRRDSFYYVDKTGLIEQLLERLEIQSVFLIQKHRNTKKKILITYFWSACWPAILTGW